MNIQSISIVVPAKGCVNDCPCCCSKMHDNDYKNSFNKFAIKKRIKFAVNNGVNTCIITSTGELFQNILFLEFLAEIFEELDHPFPNVEIQTTGVFLIKNSKMDPKIVSLLKRLGVNTISLSVFDIFNCATNSRIIKMPHKLAFRLNDIEKLEKEGFNIRLSINMINRYDDEDPYTILIKAKSLGANQITLRKLYYNKFTNKINNWVQDNKCKDSALKKINKYIKKEGTPLYRLPFGPIAYSILEMSVVLDDNCMSKNNLEALKYVILREDGKLYCQWDDRGSLIF